MPTDLTIFAAQYLVILDAVLAAAALAPLLWRQPRNDTLRWAIATVTALLVAGVLAQIGAALVSDPRPFTQDHVQPLIRHAADNGFPSDHALLAAAIVAAVILARPLWSIPFAVMAYLVDWARVGAGIHHVADVVGSSAFVAAGLLVGLAVAPTLAERLGPHLPRALMAPDRPRLSRRAGQEDHRVPS